MQVLLSRKAGNQYGSDGTFRVELALTYDCGSFGDQHVLVPYIFLRAMRSANGSATNNLSIRARNGFGLQHLHRTDAKTFLDNAVDVRQILKVRPLRHACLSTYMI